MCGLTGYFDPFQNKTAEFLSNKLEIATSRLDHRGPDAQSVWYDEQKGIGLGHTRLAIQDLSPMGAQPMVSLCKRFIIAYNGEVYNKSELKAALELTKGDLRGHSDTELILHAVSRWGVMEAVKRLAGMFAIALWDRELKSLYLIRDRLGIKPLYWSQYKGLITFGSEIKSLLAYSDISPSLNQDALSSYIQFANVPAPLSIYENIFKLEPGCIVCFDQNGTRKDSTFWSLRKVVEASEGERKISSLQDAVQFIEPRLKDTVREHMLSDVSLGAFLSGGIDSSLITALMQESSAMPVKTFSIGFEHNGYDEATHAKVIAEHLGTDHTQLYVTEEDLLSEVGSLAKTYDEPFADSSQIPTKLLARLTKSHVTVALSGDGGDEVFLGYNRYLWQDRFRKFRRLLPGPVQVLAAKCIQYCPPSLASQATKMLLGIERANRIDIGRRLIKTGLMLGARTPLDAYLATVSHWAGVLPQKLPDVLKSAPDFLTLKEEQLFRYLDTISYLPDDILTKVDRASMAHALEVRVPFLDHRVVEAAWQIDLPVHMLNGIGKRVTREILYKRVPASLIDRPKQGFAIPINQWLRGKLKNWAEQHVMDTDWENEFGLPTKVIKKAWTAQSKGQSDLGDPIWVLLMLAEWHAQHRRDQVPFNTR